jgi:O-antigen/teichoic acid export membrane protein
MLSGVFWLAVGNVFGKGLMFLSMICVARILGQTIFGELGFLRSTCEMLVTAVGFNITIMSTKLIPDLLITDKERIGKVIGLSYLVAIVLAFCLGFIMILGASFICNVANSPHLTRYFQLASILFFVILFAKAQEGILSGFQDFRAQSISTIVNGTMSLLFLIVGGWVAGLLGAMCGLIVAYFLQALSNAWFISCNCQKNEISYSFHITIKELSLFYSDGLPYLWGACIFAFCIWLGNLMLVRQENGYAEMAMIVAVLQIFAVMTMLPYMLINVIFPMLIEYKAKSDYVRYTRTLLMTIFIISSIIIPFALSICICSEWIMELFGTEFARGKTILMIYCITSVVAVINELAFRVSVSQGAGWVCSITGISNPILFIILLYFLLQNGYGALGYAVAFICGYLAQCFLTLFTAYRYTLYSFNKINKVF